MKIMIVKIKDDGMFLELLDNTQWAINPREKATACSWLPSQHVKVSEKIKGRSFNFKIENTDTGQNVFALKMK